jgi:F0F1-type ATP synthase membrane subunit c/vacuolar-type H+-ATPase subunit K
MKPVIMAALVETYAVLGLLITILMLNGITLK